MNRFHKFEDYRQNIFTEFVIPGVYHLDLIWICAIEAVFPATHSPIYGFKKAIFEFLTWELLSVRKHFNDTELVNDIGKHFNDMPTP